MQIHPGKFLCQRKQLFLQIFGTQGTAVQDLGLGIQSRSQSELAELGISFLGGQRAVLLCINALICYFRLSKVRGIDHDLIQSWSTWLLPSLRDWETSSARHCAGASSKRTHKESIESRGTRTADRILRFLYRYGMTWIDIKLCLVWMVNSRNDICLWAMFVP